MFSRCVSKVYTSRKFIQKRNQLHIQKKNKSPIAQNYLIKLFETQFTHPVDGTNPVSKAFNLGFQWNVHSLTKKDHLNKVQPNRSTQWMKSNKIPVLLSLSKIPVSDPRRVVFNRNPSTIQKWNTHSKLWNASRSCVKSFAFRLPACFDGGQRNGSTFSHPSHHGGAQKVRQSASSAYSIKLKYEPSDDDDDDDKDRRLTGVYNKSCTNLCKFKPAEIISKGNYWNYSTGLKNPRQPWQRSNSSSALSVM